jgi:tetrahydromethanopterin S-methyltransferase subunit G
MGPADSLSLILRRLDEIERKLDRMMEELRAPTAIGYSVRRLVHLDKAADQHGSP